MNSFIEICVLLEVLIIICQFWRSFRSKDSSQIWSPLNIVSLTYVYYCIVPHYYAGNENFVVDETASNAYLFHIASLLSLVVIFFTFSKTVSKVDFTKWNNCIPDASAIKNGLILFFMGFVGYGICRGFHFSIARTEKTVLMEGCFTYYIMCMTEFFPVALALLIAGWKQNKRKLWLLIPVWLIFITMIFSGSRGRIIIGVISILIMWHSYPKVRKVRYLPLVSIMVLLFLGFSIMDKTRNYGGGIDLEAASSLQMNDIKNGAQENYTVYQYSINCMDKAHYTGARYYFEPIITALLMPLPRALFPWKPDASYMKQFETQILGNTDSGAAYLNFVESYLSFGWFGVVFWAFVLGWCSKKIWSNYDRNRNHLGAIVLLCVFDGLVYMIISRGYLAQSFSSLLYGICIPIWISMLINRKSINKV